ncbi:telomere-protecting terminal protein Tpg [Streptomyces synnematoformans]|uniref:XRE family transcriptional regulator n=1 Tax=Streptomyces synnematoformans TaxID=415721 RepID=A0ABN2XUP6_9ACTN
MATIGESLEAALQATATRPIPVSPQARMRFLVKTEQGSTRRTAARLGCSQRQVERYLAGKARRPTPRLAAALEREVRRSWQPRVRARAIRHAAQRGVVVETRARFGFTAAPGSTDDPRMRRITEQLPPDVTAELLARHAAGASEAELRDILGVGLGYAYFQDRGRRAVGLDVTVTDIDHLDVGLS